MKFEIVKHAFGLIVLNFGMAMRIMLLPWAVMTVVLFMINQYLYEQRWAPSTTIPSNAGMVSQTVLEFLYVVFYIIVGIWIAMGWHRFVLINEKPNSYWPKWHGQLARAYFVRSVYITLALLLPMLAFVAFDLMVDRDFQEYPSGYLDVPWLLFWLIFDSVVSYATLRLSLGLPGAAVGNSISLHESRLETRAWSAEIWGASILIGLLYIPVYIVSFLHEEFLAAVIFAEVWCALVMLLTISVLTTLYDVIKEGHELN
jgi:hypothetical protein